MGILESRKPSNDVRHPAGKGWDCSRAKRMQVVGPGRGTQEPGRELGEGPGACEGPGRSLGEFWGRRSKAPGDSLWGLPRAP